MAIGRFVEDVDECKQGNSRWCGCSWICTAESAPLSASCLSRQRDRTCLGKPGLDFTDGLNVNVHAETWCRKVWCTKGNFSYVKKKKKHK